MSSESQNILDPAVRAELDKLNDGVPFRALKEHAHHTWARTFHSSPELFIKPQSLEEVEKAVTLARRCRKRITTVGCGHSPSDITCTSSWMVNLDDFNKILEVDEHKNLVTMQAGIRLYQLSEELDMRGLAMPNLGSINEQSIAGAISTGTHGSTLKHSILSSSVHRLKITLANGQTVPCSPDDNPDLFKAALCSLGALGIITEITFQAVPAFSLHWQQSVWPDRHMLNTWKDTLWNQGEFVRVWWFPYTRRATIWHASKTDRPSSDMPYKPGYYDSSIGYYVYHNLLWLAQYVPRILPWVERFVFGMQYGFGTGKKTLVQAIQPSRQALLMNCLYSQYVNEWAISLDKGPIALRRLSSWLNHLTPEDPDYVDHGIPISAEGLYVHAPVEVRVSDTTLPLFNADGTPRKSVRPYLDSTSNQGPTLYLNATLYRPYDMDPPCRERYYQGFEYLMRELGGRPHWAKNFTCTRAEIEDMYSNSLVEWRRVRDSVDPEGMFVGPWHRNHVIAEAKPRYELEETEVSREPLGSGGIKVYGKLSHHAEGLRNDPLANKTDLEITSGGPSTRSSFEYIDRNELSDNENALPESAKTHGNTGNSPRFNDAEALIADISESAKVLAQVEDARKIEEHRLDAEARIAEVLAEEARAADEAMIAEGQRLEREQNEQEAKRKAVEEKAQQKAAEEEQKAKQQAETQRITKEREEEARQKAQEEEDARLAAEAERVAKQQAGEERLKREEQERLARDEERQARAEQERIAQEEAMAKAEQERLAREEAERQAKAEQERLTREEAERAAKAEQELLAREKAERDEAERKAKAKAEAERKAKEEAERLAREESERKVREKEEAERKVREEAERKAREEAERIAKEEAELKAKEDVERKAREEAERRAREEAERIAKEEAERKAKEEAERKAKEEAERKAKEEAERKAKEEAERKAKEEAERKAKEEAERKAKEEAERKAKEEAERKAKEEAERKAKEEAERKAKEEAEREEREAAEKKQKQDQEREAAEEAKRKALEAERLLREQSQRRKEAEAKAREEAEGRSREAAEKKVKDIKDRLAREVAEKSKREAEAKAAEEKRKSDREAAIAAKRAEIERRVKEARAKQAQEAAETAAKEQKLPAATDKASAPNGNARPSHPRTASSQRAADRSKSEVSPPVAHDKREPSEPKSLSDRPPKKLKNEIDAEEAKEEAKRAAIAEAKVQARRAFGEARTPSVEEKSKRLGWHPLGRPNSLDELLAQEERKAKAIGTASIGRKAGRRIAAAQNAEASVLPQFRPNA